MSIISGLLNGLKTGLKTLAAPAVVIKTIDTQSLNPQRPDLVDTTVYGLDAAKDAAMWLTKGEYRNQPAEAVLLKDCTSVHLKNILINKPNLSADYRRVIGSLLQDRGETVPVPVAPLVVLAPTSVQAYDLSAPVDDLNNIV